MPKPNLLVVFYPDTRANRNAPHTQSNLNYNTPTNNLYDELQKNQKKGTELARTYGFLVDPEVRANQRDFYIETLQKEYGITREQFEKAGKLWESKYDQIAYHPSKATLFKNKKIVPLDVRNLAEALLLEILKANKKSSNDPVTAVTLVLDISYPKQLQENLEKFLHKLAKIFPKKGLENIKVYRDFATPCEGKIDVHVSSLNKHIDDINNSEQERLTATAPEISREGSFPNAKNFTAKHSKTSEDRIFAAAVTLLLLAPVRVIVEIGRFVGGWLSGLLSSGTRHSYKSSQTTPETKAPVASASLKPPPYSESNPSSRPLLHSKLEQQPPSYSSLFKDPKSAANATTETPPPPYEKAVAQTPPRCVH